jgi:predicted glycoside hydrolase/deacetylase ChbG (UPF0249 family)
MTAPPAPSRLIVNADDFGRSRPINAAVAECFERGLCSSATVMPNMPATDDAFQLVHDRKLAGFIGLHFVLDGARPLTAEIRKLTRFCDADGRLAFSRDRATFRLETSERAALAGELRAQIVRCRRAGIALTHLDSHHHVHTEWAVSRVVLRVAREERIPRVRLARNIGPGIRPAKRFYKQAFNWVLRRRGFARTDSFGSVSDVLYLLRRGRSLAGRRVEVMTHPHYDAGGRLVDQPDRSLLEPAVRSLPGVERAESFAGRRYEPVRPEISAWAFRGASG